MEVVESEHHAIFGKVPTHGEIACHFLCVLLFSHYRGTEQLEFSKRVSYSNVNEPHYAVVLF